MISVGVATRARQIAARFHLLAIHPKLGPLMTDDARDMDEKENLERVSETARISEQIEEIPAPDGAVVLRRLEPDQAAEVAEYLDPNTAGKVLAELDPEDAAKVIEKMPPPEASMVLAAMDADDRVDVLENVTSELHEQLVSELSPEHASEVRELEQYPPDKAGGIMTPEVTALPEYLTVEQGIHELRRLRSQTGEMFYVYLVDDKFRLKGVINMRDLILAPPDTPLHRVARTEVTSLPANMDQEDVADLFRRYNYLALPVVSPGGRLLGIVTVDDVIDIISQEAAEDLQRLSGAGPGERLTSPWQFSFRKRILWLIVNLVTACAAASVVGFFENTIAKMAILAVYMPVIAGMGGNAAAQAMAVAIRGIALGEVDQTRLRRVFKRELLVGLSSGMVIGSIVSLVAWTLHFDHGVLLGVAVATALTITMTVACVAGVAVPFAMRAMGFDPAQSATIFVTTITDFVGFLSFLGLAHLIL